MSSLHKDATEIVSGQQWVVRWIMEDASWLFPDVSSTNLSNDTVQGPKGNAAAMPEAAVKCILANHRIEIKYLICDCNRRSLLPQNRGRTLQTVGIRGDITIIPDKKWKSLGQGRPGSSKWSVRGLGPSVSPRDHVQKQETTTSGGGGVACKRHEKGQGTRNYCIDWEVILATLACQVKHLLLSQLHAWWSWINDLLM